MSWMAVLLAGAAGPIALPAAPTNAPIALSSAQFLDLYNQLYQRLYTVAQEAAWKASTDVTDEHTGQRIGAEQAKAAFVGSPWVIGQARGFLQQRGQLDPLTVRQLDKILLFAAECPGTIPDVVAARVAAEARQAATQDGFQFLIHRAGEAAKPITPNQIDDLLQTSTNLDERRLVWETSKQSGPVLKQGLLELRDLRNRVAREMGYSSYFGLQVAAYGMTVPEMMNLNAQLVRELRPLYEQLHCWARYQMAARYHQPVPKLIPAHWLNNRWGQEWPGLVAVANLDDAFKPKSPEWMLRTAEQFFVSLGFPALPSSFYSRSDLYELPADAKRKKNTHGSAWHLNLDQDVRSLMSVKPDFNWFTTTHHEFGHIYYDLSYANSEVPMVLRDGATSSFHEGMAELISTAVRQAPYLQQLGLLAPGEKLDQTQWLLNEALTEAIVFIPWSAGVMTSWEHDFYEGNLPADQLNQRWWFYMEKYLGIAPPTPRGEAFCDAATKTHINDNPAYYFNYALAFAIKYQFHEHLAKNILKQDPHACNYSGNREAGRFLQNILKLGATRDWRQILQENLGTGISARAMLEYYQPLRQYLQEQNQGRDAGW